MDSNRRAGRPRPHSPDRGSSKPSATPILRSSRSPSHERGAWRGWWRPALWRRPPRCLAAVLGATGWSAPSRLWCRRRSIFSAWRDAWAGTAANVILLLVVAHGLLTEGPLELPRAVSARRARRPRAHGCGFRRHGSRPGRASGSRAAIPARDPGRWTAARAELSPAFPGTHPQRARFPLDALRSGAAEFRRRAHATVPDAGADVWRAGGSVPSGGGWHAPPCR